MSLTMESRQISQKRSGLMTKMKKGFSLSIGYTCL
jgi:hypothetical protein